jgi:hypothetical protein
MEGGQWVKEVDDKISPNPRRVSRGASASRSKGGFVIAVAPGKALLKGKLMWGDSFWVGYPVVADGAGCVLSPPAFGRRGTGHWQWLIWAESKL